MDKKHFANKLGKNASENSSLPGSRQIGVYGDVSRLSGQRYRFSGTGAFLGKEGSFECLRVKLGMKLIFCKKVLAVNILHYILLAIAAMDRRKANGNNKITDRRIPSGICQ